MTHVTIIGTVTAKPDTREELLGLLAAQVAPTRAEPGCLNYDFHIDAADPCCFVFYENCSCIMVHLLWEKRSGILIRMKYMVLFFR